MFFAMNSRPMEPRLQEQQLGPFKRIGNDLYMKKTINLNEALTGVQFTVQHPHNERTILVESQPGDVLEPECERVVRNAGMPKRRAKNTFGDLYVEFEIEMPESMKPVKAKKVAELIMKCAHGKGGKNSAIFSQRDGVHTKPPHKAGMKYDIDEVSLMPFEETHFMQPHDGDDDPYGNDEDYLPHGMHFGGSGRPGFVQCAQS